MKGGRRRLVVALLVGLGLVVVLVVYARISDERGGSEVGRVGTSEETVLPPDGPALDEVETIDVPEQTTDSRGVVTIEGAEDLDASLEVLVKSKETGEPLVGAGACVRIKGWREVEKAARSGEIQAELFHPTERGRIRFRIPSGYPLEVTAQGSHVISAGPASVEIDALSPGDHREIELELPTEWVAFHGRVLAADGDHPIRGAEICGDLHVRLTAPGDNEDWYYEEPPILATDDDGFFAVVYPPWEWAGVTVMAPDYGSTFVQAIQGHESADEAFVVRLHASATARIRISYAQQNPIPGLTVRLYRMSWSGDWTGTSDEAGLCEIAGLPPHERIGIELLRNDGVVWKERDPVVFEPGEEQVIELRLGIGTNLRGVLLDEQKRPLADREIWALETEWSTPICFSTDSEEVWTKTQTDDEGRFLFEDLAPGLWGVGPGPAPLPEDVNGVDPIAPLASVVHIEAGTEEVFVTLEARIALTIRGRVVLPDGSPCASARVAALSWDPLALIECKHTAEDGSFVLGPLVSGSYRLRARPSEYAGWSIEHVAIPDRDWPWLASSELTTAEAGEEGIVLALRRAGMINASAHHAETGDPCHAAIELLEETSDRWAWGSSQELANLGGCAVFNRLPPGRYHLVARTPDERIGVADAVVVEGEITGIDLAVHPAAELLVRCEGGRTPAVLRILHRGSPVWREAMYPGDRAPCLVPPGVLTVQLEHIITDERRERVVTVSAGEEAEIVLSFDD